MAANLDAPKVKKQMNYEDQVREVIREKVLSGEFSPGEKLPSSRKIAASLGTNSFTVHQALSTLQKEGMLISYPRRGTFVKKRDKKLTCVGVYGDCSTTEIKESPFIQVMRQTLKDELQKQGIEVDLWMDSRPQEQQGEPWKPLVKAAEQRQFQAFIGIETNIPLVQWQRKLPVPTAFLGGLPSMPNYVDHDMRQFAEISLRELARQGCRSVGLIAPVTTTHKLTEPNGLHRSYFDMLEHFTNLAGDLGLTLKNEWMRIFQSPSEWAQGQERFGYKQFLKLWSQPEKPEGLVIFTDVVARGAIMAIREKQVRVPEELKLALHKAETIDLFCPMPATFVVASERDIARALIKQIKKQFRGESCEKISLPFKLAAHKNF
jgi:DNA-binding LacI/PurR family transcriptional regulator